MGSLPHRYQSTVMGSYQTIELIETFVNYAESIKRCICIVYDPQRSGTGTLALKAIKLRESFIKARQFFQILRDCASVAFLNVPGTGNMDFVMTPLIWGHAAAKQLVSRGGVQLALARERQREKHRPDSTVPEQVYKDGGLSSEKLREAGISWKAVFEEIPIHVRNSPLAAAMLATVESHAPADARDFARLNLGVAPLLEKNLEFLNDCLDDIVSEQQKARLLSCMQLVTLLRSVLASCCLRGGPQHCWTCLEHMDAGEDSGCAVYVVFRCFVNTNAGVLLSPQRGAAAAAAAAVAAEAAAGERHAAARGRGGIA